MNGLIHERFGTTRASEILPCGCVIDTVSINDTTVEITICDMANISIFVRASGMGLSGSESASQIAENSKLMACLKELRGKAAQLIEMCEDWKLVDEQSPGSTICYSGCPPCHDNADITVRLIFMNSCYATITETGAVCTAACGRIPGSVVSRELRDGSAETSVLRLNHPEGVLPIWVRRSTKKDASTDIDFDVLAFERTSRRNMTRSVFVPKHTRNSPVVAQKEMVLRRTNLLMTGDINFLNVKEATEPFGMVADSPGAA
jgi:2-methylaconitate isomerase